eukprot:g5352.t1
MEYLGPGNEGVTPQAAAGILVERLKNAGDLGDRRDALDALLKLSQDHPTDVGHAGMPIFTDILQAGIADRSMTQTIMGIMLNLVKEEGANASSFLKDVQNVQNLLDLMESTDALTALSAVQVLQALQISSAESLEACILECPAGLQALVEVLRDPREEVRNEVILFLGRLTRSNLEVKKFVAFQEGFERLFDIMSGEGMLEGGSVIVKDCLQVCHNLLRGSSLTKALFCQSGCLKRFHQLIDVRTADRGEVAGATPTPTAETIPEAAGSETGAKNAGQQAPSHEGAPHAPAMSEVQLEIACKSLDVLMLLLATKDGSDSKQGNGTGGSGSGGDEGDGDGKRSERQTLVADVEDGMLSEMLVHVAFSRADAFSHAPAVCRERAMGVTGALVAGHPTNQYNMGELLIQDVGLDSRSLATLVVEGALGKDGANPSTTEAFHWVLECLFHGNEVVCTQVVSHIIAPPPPPLELEDIEAWVPPIPPGKVLLDSLAACAKVLLEGDDGESEGRGIAAARATDVMSRGCSIVSMLFTHGGALAKELSLRVPLAPGPGAHPTTLLHALLRWLELTTSEAQLFGRAAADAAVSLMRLVCGWVYGCPAAARELLQNPANLFVIDVAAGRCALLGEGEGGEAGATAAQRVAVKGLACVMLGLLLEYLEGGAAPRSGGSGREDGEWTRGLVMKMIQNRVGMTPFMASIEATKRAFGEAETAQRRRHRSERDRERKASASDKNYGRDESRQDGANSGELRVDPAFTPLLMQASEEIRRCVISVLTHGDGSTSGGAASSESNGETTTTAHPVAEEGGPDGASSSGNPGSSGSASGKASASGGAGLAAVVELQEREIAGLREELSEALSRVPRGGGEGGGVSALEEALRNQVGQLGTAALEHSKQLDSLKRELSDALAEVDEEKESRQVLTSELQGLAVSVSALERQLVDRESVCDGLRRQLEAKAGGDSSARENELARQLDEAHARALKAEEALVVSQRQSLAEASADEAAQEASLEAAAKLETQVEQLQAALEEARSEAAAAVAQALAEADSSAKATAASQELALSAAKEDLEGARKSLLEREARVEELDRALTDKTDGAEADKRELALLKKAVEEAEASIEREQQATTAAEARGAEGAKRAASETEALREQLDNAVRSLAEASSGGNQQIEALQNELLAVQQREEQEVSEWRRRMEECSRQANEETERRELVFGQREKKLNDDWAAQMQGKEAAIARLEAEVASAKEAYEAAVSSHRLESTKLREESEGLRTQAEQVDVLMARCARLEEAAVSAGAETERRLRDEMDREKGLARGAEGSVAALSKQLEEALNEVSEKEAAATELRSRLEEVQAFLSQSEDDRAAAEAREASATSEVKILQQQMQQQLREAEEKLQNANAELEDRDAVIAVVEDARAAQEREAERLRDKLDGFGKALTPLAPRTNGTGATVAGNATGTANGGSVRELGFSAGDEGGREDLVDSAEYLELLSEHEDLLQFLAQQDVVRKKLLESLEHNAGQAAVRTAMTNAEAEVTDTYGMFVHTDGDHHDDNDHHHEQEFDEQVDATLNQAQAEKGDPADVGRTVAV